MNYNVITFYQYKHIKDPKALCNKIKTFCNTHGINGRILIAEEGINGGACAPDDIIESFKTFLLQFFTGLTFREINANEQVYHKLVCKVRKEIVVFGEKVNLENRGNYVTPQELHHMYEQNEDFIIVDARNDYEAKVGVFEDAKILPIQTFRELPNEMQQHSTIKDKKVVMYCTGGIRCEKATAYLKEQGFKDVHHLQGGIIEYMHQFPQGHFKGQLFVFDDRKTAFDGQPVVDCEICGGESTTILNCHNLDCDTLFVSCDQCARSYHNCCSKACMQSPRQRPPAQQPKKVIGRVLHYYAQPKVAHVQLEQDISIGETIGVNGKTTHLEKIRINEMRSEENEHISHANAGDCITIKINDKVRVNDLLVA